MGGGAWGGWRRGRKGERCPPAAACCDRIPDRVRPRLAGPCGAGTIGWGRGWGRLASPRQSRVEADCAYMGPPPPRPPSPAGPFCDGQGCMHCRVWRPAVPAPELAGPDPDWQALPAPAGRPSWSCIDALRAGAPCACRRDARRPLFPPCARGYRPCSCRRGACNRRQQQKWQCAPRSMADRRSMAELEPGGGGP